MMTLSSWYGTSYRFGPSPRSAVRGCFGALHGESRAEPTFLLGRPISRYLHSDPFARRPGCWGAISDELLTLVAPPRNSTQVRFGLAKIGAATGRY